MKKRLLVYAHYFYPDVASTGQILTELCEGLQDDFGITVICVVPSYNGEVHEKYKKQRMYVEDYKNIKVVRLRVPEFDKRSRISRIRNILAYFFNAIYATFKVGRQDLVFSISQPPILGGLLGVIGKFSKRSKLIYNIQDFNPEQTEAIGFAKNKLVISIARSLDKLSCRYSDVVIVVGRDMKETLKKRFKYKKVPRCVVINNWVDENDIYPLPRLHPKVEDFKKKYGLDNKLVFMYSGNLGLYYDLENIIKVIGEFKDRKDIVFVFIGDGSIKQELIDYKVENGLMNVKFIPYQDKKDLIYSLNSADVHIVTNAKGIKGVSVPSKIYGVMATGRFILGVLEEGSEASIIIKDSNAGICCEPGNYRNIFEQIKFLSSRTGIIDENNDRGYKYIVENFSKKRSISKYTETLNNILSEKSTP